MGAVNNAWVKARWARLIEEYGGQCDTCGALFDLEFAHTKPTRCRGKGRGKSRRLHDILQHRAHYRLMCMSCHDDFDGRSPRKRQTDFIKLRMV